MNQLDQAAAIHGTKRAALVAGLHALTSHAEAEAAVERLAHERDQARSAAAAATTRAEHAEATLAAQEQKPARAATDHKAETTKLKAELRKAGGQSERWRERAHTAEHHGAAWERAYHELAPLAVDELRCPRCRKWVTQDQWATRASKRTKGWEIIYHQACGYHDEETSILPLTFLGFRRAR